MCLFVGKVNNIKTVIRESQWYLPDLFVLFRYMINIIPIALLLFRYWGILLSERGEKLMYMSAKQAAEI